MIGEDQHPHHTQTRVRPQPYSREIFPSRPTGCDGPFGPPTSGAAVWTHRHQGDRGRTDGAVRGAFPAPSSPRSSDTRARIVYGVVRRHRGVRRRTRRFGGIVDDACSSEPMSAARCRAVVTCGTPGVAAAVVGCGGKGDAVLVAVRAVVDGDVSTRGRCRPGRDAAPPRRLIRRRC